MLAGDQQFHGILFQQGITHGNFLPCNTPIEKRKGLRGDRIFVSRKVIPADYCHCGLHKGFFPLHCSITSPAELEYKPASGPHQLLQVLKVFCFLAADFHQQKCS
jgi:hypothetical protein